MDLFVSYFRDIHGIALRFPALPPVAWSANCYPESICCQDRGLGCVCSGEGLVKIPNWISGLISGEKRRSELPRGYWTPSARGLSGWVPCGAHSRRSQAAFRSRRSWVTTESWCSSGMGLVRPGDVSQRFLCRRDRSLSSSLRVCNHGGRNTQDCSLQRDRSSYRSLDDPTVSRGHHG